MILVNLKKNPSKAKSGSIGPIVALKRVVRPVHSSISTQGHKNIYISLVFDTLS